MRYSAGQKERGSKKRWKNDIFSQFESQTLHFFFFFLLYASCALTLPTANQCTPCSFAIYRVRFTYPEEERLCIRNIGIIYFPNGEISLALFYIIYSTIVAEFDPEQ